MAPNYKTRIHYNHLASYVMRPYRKITRVVWIAASVIVVIGMIAFTLLPVIYYR